MYKPVVWFRMFFMVACSVFAGTVVMILLYSLPVDSVQRHVRQSMEFYEHKSSSPEWANGIPQTHIDFFTEAVMLQRAVYPSDQNAVYAAMMNFGWHHLDELNGTPESPEKWLAMWLNHEDSMLVPVPYPKYWHGYLLWLKPLLSVASVGYIRVLNSYVVLIFFAISLLMFYRHLGLAYALAFCLSILSVNLVTISMSFQNSSIYYIFMVALIIMLWKNDTLFSRNLYPYFFCGLGITVAFLDFLTYPIAAVGFPLMLYYLLNRNHIQVQSALACILSMTGLLLSFGGGYVGMWSGKWIVSYLLTGYDTITDGLYRIMHYTQASDSLSKEGWHLTRLDAIKKNISAITHGPIRIFLFGTLAYLIYALTRKKSALHLSHARFLPYAFVASLPFLWYVVSSGHSYIHADFFTHRGLSVSLFAMLCFMIDHLNLGGTPNA